MVAFSILIFLKKRHLLLSEGYTLCLHDFTYLPARRVFPDHRIITSTRTSADVSVPRFAGFSLIT